MTQAQFDLSNYYFRHFRTLVTELMDKPRKSRPLWRELKKYKTATTAFAMLIGFTYGEALVLAYDDISGYALARLDLPKGTSLWYR